VFVFDISQAITPLLEMAKINVNFVPLGEGLNVAAFCPFGACPNPRSAE
jgi:hypothetical protein